MPVSSLIIKNYPTASYFNIGQVKHIQVYPRRKECYKAKGAQTQRTKNEQKNRPNKSARWRSACYYQLILLRFGEGFTREIFDHVLHHITSQLTNICQMQLTKTPIKWYSTPIVHQQQDYPYLFACLKWCSSGSSLSGSWTPNSTGRRGR